MRADDHRQEEGPFSLEHLLSSVLVREEATGWILNSVSSIAPRWLRYLASYYPDARVRRACLIQSGVKVGDDTYPNYGMHVIDRYNQTPREDLLTIGARVAMGPRVTFICDSSPNAARLWEVAEIRDLMVKKAPVVVGDDVWIGAGATVLPGVHIHDMSIVGAHSLVRDDVPAYSVVAGCPARILRSLRAPVPRPSHNES